MLKADNVVESTLYGKALHQFVATPAALSNHLESLKQNASAQASPTLASVALGRDQPLVLFKNPSVDCNGQQPGFSCCDSDL